MPNMNDKPHTSEHGQAALGFLGIMVIGILFGIVITGFCLGPQWLEHTLGLYRK